MLFFPKVIITHKSSRTTLTVQGFKFMQARLELYHSQEAF